MKKLITTFLTLLIGASTYTQVLTEIPSPNTFTQNLTGYRGSPIVLGSDLHLQYGGNDSNMDLFKYDGTSLTEITSPVGFSNGGPNNGYAGMPVAAGSNLYLRYKGDDGNYDLFTYDGTNLTEVPSPAGFSDNTRGYFGQAIAFGNDVYLNYRGNDGNQDLFKFDGTNLTEIPSPAGFTADQKGYFGNRIIFDNDLYLQYWADNSNYVLFKYDGTTLTEITSPVGFTKGFYGSPLVIGNDLFLRYAGDDNNYDLMKYDGTTFTEITSPSGYTGSSKGYIGEPIVVGSDLYMQYRSSIGNYDLMKYDGSSLIPIPSPVGYTGNYNGYRGVPEVIGTDLYMRYLGDDGNYDLFKYDGTNLTEISSPAGFTGSNNGYLGYPIVVDNALYMRYLGDDGNYDLFKYDGTTLTEIPSPQGFTDPAKGYVGSQIAIGNNLYLRYSGNDGVFDLFKLSTSAIGVTIDTTICANSIYTSPVNSTNYSSSQNGIIETLKTTDALSDSIIYTINLTVLSEVTGIDNQTSCVSFTWIDGVTYNASTNTPTFSIVGGASSGCDSLVTLNLTINPLPTIEAGTPLTVCNGEQVTLSGSGASTYQWNNGITNNTAFTPTLGTTTYTLTGTDGNGCVETDNVTVTANVLPTVDAGTNQTVCEGETVTLAGSGATTYSWNNGITDNVSFTPTLGVTNYTVIGTDVNGCTNTDMVAITTNSVPVVDAGANQAVCEGETVTLNGSGASTYLWNNGVTNNISFTPSTGATTYSVTGTNNAGCSGSDNLTVTVNTLPNASTTLSGNVITADLTGANYQWVICNNSNTEINGETGNSFTANANGDYAVIVSLNGCADTSTCVNVASVGINESAIFNEVSVYPNPIKDVVTIQLGGLKDVSLTVYSITGKIVYEVANINSTVHQFNLNSAAGVYLLSLVTNGQTNQYKLIKE